MCGSSLVPLRAGVEDREMCSAVCLFNVANLGVLANTFDLHRKFIYGFSNARFRFSFICDLIILSYYWYYICGHGLRFSIKLPTALHIAPVAS